MKEVASVRESETAVLYLVLGFVWLSLAIAAFVMPHVNPDHSWTIPNTDISIGWVGLFFFAYNMARWWGTRKQVDRRLLTPTPPKPLHPDQPADPTFNFTDQPPRPTP